LKALVWLAGMSLSIGSWVAAYKYAKRKPMWLPPANFAIVVASLTLLACMVIVVLLDKMGWYFD